MRLCTMTRGLNPTSMSERSSVCLVHLVCLVYLVNLVQLVSFVQPTKQTRQTKPTNKRDRPGRPNEQGRVAGFFSILLTNRETVYDGA